MTHLEQMADNRQKMDKAIRGLRRAVIALGIVVVLNLVLLIIRVVNGVLR